MKIIAADDEKLALESLISSIKKCCPDDEIVGFNNSKELLEYVGSEKCDIAFLDIKMNGVNGVEVARRMKLKNSNVNIIFVTGYPADIGCGRHNAGFSIFAQKAKTSHNLSCAVVFDSAGSRRIYRSDRYIN